MKDDFSITGLVKDWVFRVTETEPGQFEMQGMRRSGESVSMCAMDRLALAESVGREARRLDEPYLNPQVEPGRRYYFNTDLPEVFPPELKRILLDEILLGNWICDYWQDFGHGVQLAEPFQVSRQDVEPPLEYREVNDPHYWKDEVHLIGSDCFVATSFSKTPG